MTEGFDYTKSVITYSRLSPHWLLCQVTVSIMTGLARNAISHAVDDDCKISTMENKISHSQILDIIKTADRNKAINVYKNVILPFYDKYIHKDEDMFLRDVAKRRVITKFVEDGFETWFKPEKTVIYWRDMRDHMGLDYFIDDFGSTGKKWNEINEDY